MVRAGSQAPWYGMMKHKRSIWSSRLDACREGLCRELVESLKAEPASPQQTLSGEQRLMGAVQNQVRCFHQMRALTENQKRTYRAPPWDWLNFWVCAPPIDLKRKARGGVSPPYRPYVRSWGGGSTPPINLICKARGGQFDVLPFIPPLRANPPHPCPFDYFPFKGGKAH